MPAKCQPFCSELHMSTGYLFIPATNGVVLATEKKHKSILYDEHSIHKIEMITKNIGMVYSGMGPDYRYGNHANRQIYF